MHLYKQQNIENVSMEVSSHALSQHRVDGIDFKQAIFTNLTQDHLDYHHTMQAYAEAKALLFQKSQLEWAIINQDDPYHKIICGHIPSQVHTLTYGLDSDCDVKALCWTSSIDGIEMDVQSPWGRHHLHINALGKFNIYNSLAIISSLAASGYAWSDIEQVMAKVKPAPGRLELVAQNPWVLIDYAHTPDALQNVLLALAQIKKGQLWVVFGCGGDRDKGKRAVMGKIACLYADKVVITSDNPRSEDPKAIINDIISGMDSAGFTLQIVLRAEAIRKTLSMAAANDIVLIAGKGHETYQQIGSSKLPFSDHQVVGDYFAKRAG